MKKNKRNGDFSIDVSGDIDIDFRGRVKVDADADEASRRGASVKKKKRRAETKVVVEEEDSGPYKKGVDPKSPKRRKKRVIEGEVIETKGKKSSSSKELVPVGDKLQKKTAKQREKAMKAIEEFVLLPETGDEFDSQYRNMFDNAVRLAGLLEEQMSERANSRDIYALNTLYSQIRELIADMRATRDIGQQIAEIEQTVLGPFMKQVGQIIVDMFFSMQTNITSLVKNADIREELMKRLKNSAADQGARVQEEYATLTDKLRKVLM